MDEPSDELTVIVDLIGVPIWGAHQFTSESVEQSRLVVVWVVFHVANMPTPQEIASCAVTVRVS